MPQSIGCRFDLNLRLKVVEQNIFTTVALNFIDANDNRFNYHDQESQQAQVFAYGPEQTSLKAILVADDSRICVDVLKNQLNELNVYNKCEFFYSGDLVLEYAIQMI